MWKRQFAVFFYVIRNKVILIESLRGTIRKAGGIYGWEKN